MLIRIVRMTFDPERTDIFLDIFNGSKAAIESMPGCLHLELLRDLDTPHVYVTHSHWESAKALENYRKSVFFREVWQKTKVLFVDKPLAFSVERMPD